MAREIARIVGATKEEGYFEGGGYAVTWAFGHLVQPAMPDGYGVRGFVRDNLPIIPGTFTLVPRQVRTEKGYKPDSGVVSQIKVIKDCSTQANISSWRPMPDARLIFRYLYLYIGCATPFVRLWISSLTDKAIREGMRNLEAGSKYDNLYLAAKARSEADWLVGINGTQALSIAAGHGTYSVGGCRPPRWRWSVNAIGRTDASRPKPSGSSISQLTAAATMKSSNSPPLRKMEVERAGNGAI